MSPHEYIKSVVVEQIEPLKKEFAELRKQLDEKYVWQDFSKKNWKDGTFLSFWDEVDVRDKDDLEDGWDSGWVYVWTIEWVHLCTRYEDELEDFKNCERYLSNFTTFHFVRKTKKNTTNN